MFVYRLSEPIDFFDGLTPLNDRLAGQHPNRTASAPQAVLALTHAAGEVGWQGVLIHPTTARPAAPSTTAGTSSIRAADR